MKNINIIITVVAIILANIAMSQTAVPNGDFENWTDEFHIPYWDGYNYDGNFLHIHTFSRTDDAHSGNYAAQVETINDNLFGVIAGFAFTGTIEVDPSTLSYTLELGVPVSGKPQKLTGYFKYNAVENDTCVIVVAFSKWNEQEHDRDSIGGGLFFYSGTVNEYTPFDVDINYFIDDEPDTMYIVLSASADTYHPGSVLKVDDLGLSYTSGVNNIEANPLKCYPNPAYNFVNIELDRHVDQAEMTMTDMLGMTILYRKFYNSNKLTIPVSGLPGGFYLITVTSGKKTVARQKVWIAH